jgi:nucleoid-associated protein YgaU
MISANSRYANSTLVPATNLDGNDILAVTFNEPVNTVIQYQNYVVTGSDTIDGLAYKIFGDGTLWWAIANLNPEILDFSAITTGQTIRIPVVTGVAL